MESPAGRPWRRVFGPEPLARQVAAHTLSTAGDAFFAVSLAGSLFFSVSLDAARPQVLVYLATTMAPFAVVAPVIGPVIDRFRGGPRAVIVAAFLLRAGLAFLMAGDLRRLLFYPEAFGILVLGKTYSVAKSALVPGLVPGRGDLVAANSRLTATGVVGGAAGGAVAAGLLAAAGAPWTLRVGSLVYLAGALVTLRIPRVLPAPDVPLALEYEELKTPRVAVGAWTMAVLRAAVGFMTFALAFGLRRAGEPAWFFGLVLAAGGIGGFVGSLVATWLRRRLTEERILALALTVPAALAVFASLRFTRPGVIAAALGVGIGAAAGRQAFDSLVQSSAPDADRGRTFARFETRFQLAWVLGAFVPVAAAFEARLAVGILAAGLAVASVWYLGGSRFAARFHEDLEVLKGMVLVDPPEHAPETLVREMLETARRLHERGAPRRAVVQAFAALDVALERAARSDGGPLPDPREAALREAVARCPDPPPGLEHRLGHAARLRERSIHSAERLGDDEVEEAVRAVTELVDALDRLPPPSRPRS